MAKIQGADKVTVNVQVNDDRKDKILGNKVNGYNMKMAGISAKEDVAITLKNAIEDGLRAKGFNAGNNATVKITADITKFYADARYLQSLLTSSAAYDSSFNAKVSIKSYSGGISYTKELTATGYSAKFLDAGGNSVEAASNQALANAVNQLLDDKEFIAALLSTAEPTADVAQPVTPTEADTSVVATSLLAAPAPASSN